MRGMDWEKYSRKSSFEIDLLFHCTNFFVKFETKITDIVMMAAMMQVE